MPVNIHVISLAEADQRREHVRAQLDRLGCAFSFFDAADGSAGRLLFEAVNTRKHLINTGRLPTTGEIGCYASHLGLWQRCVTDNEPICILEDDCHLEDFFPAALTIASRLVAQYGFIRLQTETRAQKRPVRKVDDFQLYRYTKMAHSTLAYVIGPDVAKSFIEHSTVMNCPVDVFIKQFWEHGNALYGLAPYAALESQLACQTSIGDRRRPQKDLITRLNRVMAKTRSFLCRTAFNRRFARTRQNMNP